MNYGMYVSASGALVNLHKQDVLANNLANVRTVGFKPDYVDVKARLPERLEDGASFADPAEMLEKLGGGIWSQPTRTSLAQGELVKTGNDLDVAIRGDGFFAVTTGKGKGNARLRFTRDGRFTLNSKKELVLATNGMRVLDSNDRIIRFNGTGTIRIHTDGKIMQGDQVVGRLQVTEFPDLSSLQKDGASLFRLNNNAQESRQVASVSVEQGYVESSAVDPILALNDLIAATKSVQSNLKMIQFQDNLMDQAINRFGRVA